MQEQVRGSVWHHEVKKVQWILRKDLKNRQQVPYWSKAAENMETFLFFHLLPHWRNQRRESEKKCVEKLVKNIPFGDFF
jgi:hypothetical protein